MDDDNTPEPSLDDRLDDIECALAQILELLLRLTRQEEEMSAEQSAEAIGLEQAVEALQTELADVSAVDAEIVADLEVLPGLLAKVPTGSPEAVNAIAAVTSTLASLTAKVKAAAGPAETAEKAAEPVVVESPTPSPTKAVPVTGAEKTHSTVERTVYTNATGGEDSRFSPSGFRVPGSLEALFAFSGDLNPGEVNGEAVPGYVRYTGPTEVVPTQ